jgi:hypothetical protein
MPYAGPLLDPGQLLALEVLLLNELPEFIRRGQETSVSISLLVLRGRCRDSLERDDQDIELG